VNRVVKVDTDSHSNAARGLSLVSDFGADSTPLRSVELDRDALQRENRDYQKVWEVVL
jgi:hypothetical protein